MFQRWKGDKDMKYKLLKDTPTIKAGTIFEEVASDFNQWKELVRITPIGAKTSPQFTIQDIDNFDEWFEEIKEPTDSIHWKPKIGDRCFVLENTNIRPTAYTGMLRDYNATCIVCSTGSTNAPFLFIGKKLYAYFSILHNYHLVLSTGNIKP